MDPNDVPEWSEEMRLKVLEKAGEFRKKRAVLLRRLYSGEIKVSEMFARSDDRIIARSPIKQLIEKLPGMGKVEAVEVLRAFGITDGSRVSALNEDQKAKLVEYLS